MSDQVATPIFGYGVCAICDAPVLTEILFKTGGLCAPHFRERSADILDAAMVVMDGREKIVLKSRSKRSPAVRAQRARARQRQRQKPEEKDRRRVVAGCQDRATRRLRRLVPELYEVLLADERARAGLAAYTIDMALTPGDGMSALSWVEKYCALERAS